MLRHKILREILLIFPDYIFRHKVAMLVPLKFHVCTFRHSVYKAISFKFLSTYRHKVLRVIPENEEELRFLRNYLGDSAQKVRPIIYKYFRGGFLKFKTFRNICHKTFNFTLWQIMNKIFSSP